MTRLIALYYDTTDHLLYVVGRLRCALFGTETLACRGRQQCWTKHHGGKQ